jgi:uncharacterized repeat protein (TIGR02543 family)
MKTLSLQPLKTVRRNVAGILAASLSALFLSSAGAYELNSQEQQLSGIFASAPGQNRPSLNIDPVLCQVARSRAADMAKRNYFDHVNPDGHGPNYLVRQAGYALPSWWDTNPKANYIESIAGGYTSPSAAWDAWMNSTPHRTHLLATNSFYADQTNFGVGFAYDSSSTYQYYWVVITAPPQPQPLVVLTPAANGSVTDSAITASGTADPTGVDHIEWSVENAQGTSSWQNASGIALWTAQVGGLVAGVNTLHVRSVGAASGVIAAVDVPFIYAVHSTLRVSVSGSGSVSAGFEVRSDRLVGIDYTVKATPVPGWLFTGWTGGVTSSSAVLHFTMTDGLALTANFIPNPFKANIGGYQALVDFMGRTGNMQLKLNATGGFSGRLVLSGTAAYRFKGVFDAAGTSQIQLGGTTALLSLDMNTGAMSVTIDGVATELGHYTSSAGALTGRYNIVLPGTPVNEGGDCPQGTGCAVVTVATNGAARITGKLGDASTFVCGGFLSRDGMLTVFAMLPKGAEATAGYLTFSSSGSSVSGELAWSRAANPTALLFPNGFEATIKATGDRYDPLAAPQAPLTDATLTLGSGNLGTEIVNAIVAGVDASNGSVTVRVNASAGFVSGQFVHPADNKRHTFRGVILPSQKAAFGYFVGVNQTGYVSLVAQ